MKMVDFTALEVALPIRPLQHQFVITERYFVTKNMLRLVVKLNEDSKDMPLTYAGLAYLFRLNSPDISNAHGNLHDNAHGNAEPKICRYFTIRKAWQEPDLQHTLQTWAWIDIYLHQQSPATTPPTYTLGGQWATTCEMNTTLTTERTYCEHLDHLTQGQALLIADETSLPTVARLLELWQNPLPPVIISLTQDIAEQDYLAQVLQAVTLTCPTLATTKILPIILSYHGEDKGNEKFSQQVSTTLLQTLGEFLLQTTTLTPEFHIQKVWAGLEVNTIKTLRKPLLSLLQLTRADGVLKVYWRNDT